MNQNGDIASEIIPGLWIGNKKIVNNMYFLTKWNIATIISCTSNRPKIKYDVEKLHIPFSDLKARDSSVIYNFLNDIVKFIDEKISGQKPLLIHCSKGFQKSPTIVAAYLIKHTKCSADDAIKLIKSKREMAFDPMPQYYDALKTFEKCIENI